MVKKKRGSFVSKVRKGEKTILYELLPLPKKLTQKDLDTSLGLFARLLKEQQVDGINIPEVREEKREGDREDPEIAKLTPIEMAQALHRHVSQTVVLNRGIVYESWEDQQQWLTHARKKVGIESIVLVGGESSKRRYPGISVTEAAKKITENDADVLLGGITIPTRHQEAKRVLQKSNNGVTFFTTQILYESKAIKKLLRDYWRLCQKQKVAPSMIFLSFAPVTIPADIRLLKWLGVEILDKTKAKLTGWLGIGTKSLVVCEDVLNDILTFVKKEGIRVPLGINVEHVNRHNFEISFQLLERLTKRYLQK